MTGEYVASMAEEFSKVLNCYLKGFWGQYMSDAEYKRVLNLYPDNAKYGNQKYVGTDCFAFDCICFVKAILGGATPQSRISYSQMKSNPIGDCDNTKFYKILYDTDTEPMPGYGIASSKHAGIVLGKNKWIDCNFTNGGQNGLAIHYSDPRSLGYKVGKIPGVSYESPVPEPDEVQDFLNFLYKLWKESKK